MQAGEITEYSEHDKAELINVWESSVRATHHFLTEENILHIKSMLEDLDLSSFDIKLYRTSNQKLVGFIGTTGRKIDMLFVHPDFFKKGIGRKLLLYAIHQKDACEVIVNEQNPSAIKFYQSFGFQITDRSDLDEQGNPFPIVKMLR